MPSPKPMSINLLGPPDITVGGQPLVVDTRKAIGLAAYLVSVTHHPSRDELVDLFWSDLDQDRGRAALRRTLSALRAGLGAERLRADRDRVELNRLDLVADIDQVLASPQDDHGHGPDQVCPDCIEGLRHRLGLFRGRFLHGFYLRDTPRFEEWQRGEIELHRRIWRELVERLGLALASAGRFGEAAEVVRTRIDDDPLDEVAHRQLMQYLVWSGDRPAALRQYRQCAGMLDRELGVPPLSETRELYELILEGIDPLPPTERIDRFTVKFKAAPTPFVGRKQELDQLRQGVRHVLIEGEEGIGKTRLLGRWLEEVTGPLGLTRAAPGVDQVPYLPIQDLLQQGAAHNRLAPPGAAGEAVRLVPQLIDAGFPEPGLEGEGPLAATHFHAGLAEALDHLFAGGRIVVDDAQWLDPSSASTLAVFLSRPREARLVLAWRRGELSGSRDLSLLVDRLTREGAFERVLLGPMNEEDSLDLLLSRRALTSDQAGRIIDKAQGNPLFLVAYQDALGSESEELPADLDRLLSHRFDRLSDVAGQVLATAAVLGASAEFGLLRQVSGRSDLEVAEAIEEMINLRLADETADGIAFAHDAVRRAAVARLSRARSRILHGRAADAMAHLGPSGLLGSHLAEAGRTANAADVYFRAALASIDLHAYESGEALLETAAALGYPDRDRLSFLLGTCAVRTGKYRTALEAFATVREGPEVGLEVGRVYMRLGRWSLAEAALARASELSREPTQLGQIAADRAVVSHRLGNDRMALALTEKARDHAESSDDNASRAQAANLAGMLAPSPELAITELIRARNLAEATGRSDLIAAALNNLALAYRKVGEMRAARDAGERALELLAPLGDRHRIAALHSNLADILHQSGEAEEARRHLTESARLLAEVGGDGWEPEIWKLAEW